MAVLVRGDHEVNEAKLARVLRAPALKLASAATIERLTHAPVGFTGPVGLGRVRVIADSAAMGVVNGGTGANKAEAHLIHVNPGRDFTPAQVADLRLVSDGDPCPRCGKALAFVRAIEVGHVFKLGTKYTQVFGAAVQDQGSRQVPMIMGCYGIGVNRILAALIEQCHDEHGLIWPPTLSPFHVVVSVLETANQTLTQLGGQLTEQLEQAGLEVLFDDREQSPGSKLKDADLIGIPIQVLIGKVWQQHHQLEVVERASKTRHQVAAAELVPTVQKLLDKLSPR